jgi:nucleoside-diphosphate-sugar epimerase
MRVLVTGSTSLLGRTVVEQLIDRGDDVSVFQRSPSGLDVEEHLGDIADGEAVAGAVAGAQAVIHVAGRVAMTGQWSLFEETNIVGTQNVVDAARSAGVDRLVQVSSPSVAYGGSLIGAPAGPADPSTARGDYGRSKAQAELIALAADSPGMSVVAIRPHLIWGPGDTQLVGRAVSRARNGLLTIVGSGAALVDTTYIDNAAASLIAALDRAPSIGGRAFVVTNGQPRPVRELLSRFVMAAGLQPPRIRVPLQAARIGGRVAEEVWNRWGRDDDPPMTSFAAEQLATAHWFDQRETRQALGWEPEVSLAEGFAHLSAWFSASRQQSPRAR